MLPLQALSTSSVFWTHSKRSPRKLRWFLDFPQEHRRQLSTEERFQRPRRKDRAPLEVAGQSFTVRRGGRGEGGAEARRTWWILAINTSPWKSVFNQRAEKTLRGVRIRNVGPVVAPLSRRLQHPVINNGAFWSHGGMTTMVIVSYVGPSWDRVLGTRPEISDGNETDQKQAPFFTALASPFDSRMAPGPQWTHARNALPGCDLWGLSVRFHTKIEH